VEEVKDQTGWDLKVASDLATTQPPTAEYLQVLRDLNQKTKEAHASAS
jgi:glutaconate CoA-transferase subunit B